MVDVDELDTEDRQVFRLQEIKLPAESFGPTGKTLDGYGVLNRVESN